MEGTIRITNLSFLIPNQHFLKEKLFSLIKKKGKMGSFSEVFLMPVSLDATIIFL